MNKRQKERMATAQKRVVAAWLSLDGNTDAATLTRMIDIAFQGREQRKQHQRRGQVSSADQSTARRVRIIERDKQTCYMCKRKLAIEEVTLDHVRPRSRGGDDSEANLRVACEPCNNRKGDRLPEECDWLK